jgi:hypothetical protein
MKQKPILILFFGLLIQLATRADHLPKSKTAGGRPESRLGPVRLDRTRVDELIHVFGKPREQKKISDDTNGTRGERVYSWDVRGAKLEARTWFQPKGESPIDSVEVSGQSSVEFATGRGLKLGGTVSEISRLYGRRYQSGKRSDGLQYVFLQWPDGTELHIDMDRGGHIVRMLLTAPQE